jgi:hypothetical protein
MDRVARATDADLAVWNRDFMTVKLATYSPSNYLVFPNPLLGLGSRCYGSMALPQERGI